MQTLTTLIGIFITLFNFFLEKRQRGRFAGFSLYISRNDRRDTESLCYTDGPQLPSLNITIACARSGQYILFFNNRSFSSGYPPGYESTVVTELCEVFVYGKASFHYSNYYHHRSHRHRQCITFIPQKKFE